MMDVAGAFTDHHGDVLAFVRSRVRDPDLADDLAGDVFERACRHADKVNNWKPYLLTAARNAITDHYRRSRPQPAPLDEWVAAPTSVEGEVLTRLALLAVKDGMARLTPRERQAVMARAAMGSLREAVAVTGRTHASIATAISRGTAKLRKL